MLPLSQVHEVATENHDWNSDDEENETDGVQQRMKMVVEQPSGGKYKSDRKGETATTKHAHAATRSQATASRFIVLHS